jgi:hypothetical protein
LLKARETPFSENEATPIVRERNDAQKTDYQGERSGSKCQCGRSDRSRGDPRSEQQPTAAAKRAELRDESKPSIRVADDHARDEWQSNADMVTVVHHDVVEALQLVAEQVEVGVEGFQL